MALLEVTDLLFGEAAIGEGVIGIQFRILGSLRHRLLAGLHVAEKFALHLEEVHNLSLAVKFKFLQLTELGLRLFNLLLQSKKSNGLFLDFLSTGRLARTASEHGAEAVSKLLWE